MPINNINVTMTVAPANVLCPPPGGVFVVTAVVTGTAAGRGGSYDLGVYDQDWIWDDRLVWKPANGVLPGNFRDVHTLLLKCDPNCEVRGPAGTSGESTAEVYVWVNGGRNVTDMSAVHILRCTSDLPDEPRQDTPQQRPPEKRPEA